MNQISDHKKPVLLCTVFLFYIVCSTAFYGWEIVGFYFRYSDLNDQVLGQRLTMWMSWQRWILTVFVTICFSFFLWQKAVISAWPLNKEKFFRHRHVQMLVLLISIANFSLYQLQLHRRFVELIAVCIVMWALFALGNQFLHSKNAAWNHPTTIGAFYIMALLAGLSLILLTHVYEDSVRVSESSLVVLLLFDLSIFVARLRYLGSATPETNRLARQMLGSSLLYTGVRLIIGVFIPLVFAVYIWITGQNFGHSMAVLIILGLWLDRYMFLCLPVQYSAVSGYGIKN